MREAIAAHDGAVMLELTSSANLPRLTPGSIFVLSAELWGDGSPNRRPDVFRILHQALRLHPGDFVLQAVTGTYYQTAGDFESALACRNAAVGLRPNDFAARVKVGETLYFLGRLTDALALLRACIETDATSVEANDLLGLVQIQLGDYVGGLASFSRAPELKNDPGSLGDLYMAQFLNGVLSREQFARLIESEVTPAVLATYCLALVEHPDPKQRDPQLALRTIEERAPLIGTSRFRYVVEAIARVRLEDWPGALAAIEHRYRRPYIVLLTPMAYDFLRSVIYSHLERAEEARACYERGMVAWEEQTTDEPGAWEHSDAMRWRREAEAALAK
jgi:tetratricopeptide (TPR) repeat protein